MTYLMNEGTEIGPYRLEQQIGRGGMAEVWKGFNTSLQRYEALKFIAQHVAHDRDLADRFLTETRVVAGLSHPNIVTIYTVSQPAEARPYYAMELLAGPTLSQYVRSRPGGRLLLAEAVAILSQVAEALDYAHTRGIVHRDVKPSNIMLAGMVSGGGPLVKVVDFGIAKILMGGTHGSVYTQTGAVIGTPDYMAPEQASGRFPVSGATDQYALACVAYELLTGQPPYVRGPEETDLAVLMRHVSDPVPDPRHLLPNLPGAAAETVMRALAKEPGQRFTSCREFVATLARSPQQVASPMQDSPYALFSEQRPNPGDARAQETVFRGAAGEGERAASTYPPIPPAPPVPPGTPLSQPPRTVPPVSDGFAGQSGFGTGANIEEQRQRSAFEQVYGPQPGVNPAASQVRQQAPPYQAQPYRPMHSDVQQAIPLPPGLVRFHPGVHSVGLAVALQLLFSWASAGEFYNRQWQKGLAYIGLGIFSFIALGVAGYDSSTEEATGLAMFIVLSSIVLYILRIIDVVTVAIRLTDGRPVGPWDWFGSRRRGPDGVPER